MTNTTEIPPASLSVATGAPTMEGVRGIIFEGWTHGSSFEDIVEVIEFTYMGVEGVRGLIREALTDLMTMGAWAGMMGKRALKEEKAVAVEEEEEEEDNESGGEEEEVPTTKGKGRKRRDLKEEAKKRKERKKENRVKKVKAQGRKKVGGGAKGPGAGRKEKGKKEEAEKEEGEEEEGEKQEAVVVATLEGGPMVFDDPMDIDPVEPDIVEPLLGGMRRLVVDVWSVHLPSDVAGALVRDRPYQREGAGGEQRSYRKWCLGRAIEGKRRRRKARKAKRGSP
ncbi:hypothetical protein TWF506_007690 [Arthrobotrys conoides]|uniref:Uncharacterized protein n=1 Tax=Arthrobotrys conoides TaxID=74498 RepID=A0AAN8NRQ5_9PEZI